MRCYWLLLILLCENNNNNNNKSTTVKNNIKPKLCRNFEILEKNFKKSEQHFIFLKKKENSCYILEWGNHFLFSLVHQLCPSGERLTIEDEKRQRKIRLIQCERAVSESSLHVRRCPRLRQAHSCGVRNKKCNNLEATCSWNHFQFFLFSHGKPWLPWNFLSRTFCIYGYYYYEINSNIHFIEKIMFVCMCRHVCNIYLQYIHIKFITN